MFKRVLTISAHADDTAVCAGATLINCYYTGAKNFDITFSQHRGVPVNYFPELISKEHEKAMKILKVGNSKLYDIGACNGEFISKSGWVRHTLEEARDTIRPDLVLTHPSFDTNQDHEALNKEVVRTFKSNCTILTYDFPANVLRSEGAMVFFRISGKVVSLKLEAVQAYQSQYRKDHLYMTSSVELASIRGMQIGREYAEAFYIERFII